MTAAIAVDRRTLFRNLKKSGLLSPARYELAYKRLRHVKSPREICKALASWKLVTKFQAKMLLLGGKGAARMGPYRVVDEIGKGGMGRVYRAIHQTMDRTVALKVLTPQLTDTRRAAAMFRREIRAAARLHHPNIVMAFDADEANGQHYFAMEYVDGPNLEQFVNDRPGCAIGMACEIIFQTAGGLQHAHEQGVVHRDIKPANLLLQREPGGVNLQVKILDFGLARLRRENCDDGIRTSEEHRLMGTPDFLSPEQAKNVHTADIRSDLYSLGCTFYFLLTGRAPFPEGSLLEKLDRHDRREPTPIETLRNDVPREVADIIRKLMAKKPSDRYQTPSELMDALAPFAAPTPLDPEDAKRTRPAVSKSQTDTEPRVLGKTLDTESHPFLEWAKQQAQEPRKMSVALVAGLAALAGLATVAAVTLAMMW